MLQNILHFFVWLGVAAIGLGNFSSSSSAQTVSNELTTVEAVRHLNFAQTEQKIPVHLRGVVTFFEEEFYSRFLQDGTGGIYLQFPANVGPPPLVPGQLVELKGYCSPGEYAPVVVVDHVEVFGEAPLPKPKVVTYEVLASGVDDSQFIEITGIVRSAKKLENSPYRVIEIATGGGRLLIYLKQPPVQNLEELLDSTVRVRGVCSTKFNHQRQLFAIRVMVPGPEELKIIVPAPKDPFAMAARPIGSLLQFAPEKTYAHRVKVAGTVTSFTLGEMLFLQDQNQGIKVQTKNRDPLQPGDRVEVLGFISQGDYTPGLQDATFRKVAAGRAPDPVPLTPDEILKGDHDCRLVKVSARVLDRALHGAERYLILQDGDFIFHAYLPPSAGEEALNRLVNGSRVSASGICQIDPGEWQAGEAWRAKGFSIMLRSTSDIVLLRAPPWWTLSRVLWMAGALACTAFAAFVWVAVLRREVTDRTEQLELQIRERQRAERHREIAQERARLAHDLHDDLGAGLTEVNILSSLAKSPTTSDEEKQNYLADLAETARRMVTSLDEIVWAVNPRNDTVASLASYFGSYAQRLLDLAGITCGLDIDDELPDHQLDPKFRQQIFFALKEALTNIVRHASATQVWLRVFIRDKRLIVEVADNGKGFASSQQTQSGDGLPNMKERLRSLGGDCEIESDHRGTTLRFSAPLPENLL